MLRLLPFFAVLMFMPRPYAALADAPPAAQPPVLALQQEHLAPASLPNKTYPSLDQHRRKVPRRVAANVYPPPDRGSCLPEMDCMCGGGRAVDGTCPSGNLYCSRSAGAFCAYVCEDPFACYTLTEQECNESREC